MRHLSDFWYFNSNFTTESTCKDTGALIVEGGVGIEKFLLEQVVLALVNCWWCS